MPLDIQQRLALKRAAAELEELAGALKYRQLYGYKPFPKQAEFHRQGATHKFRALFAGNQDGKTFAGAAETAMHLTGLYPDWWEGRRWTRPVEWWCAGEGGLLVRDAPQTLLCGKPGVDEEWGAGLIPLSCLVGKTRAHGTPDLYDTITVRHHTGGREDGTSYLSFKSYDQGRTKFQSKTLDGWWADEEPPEDVDGELRARISATDGAGFYTFTPLKGNTPMVLSFLDHPDDQHANVVMTIDEGIKSLLPKETRARIVQSYKPHERAARAYGVPMAGEGAVFDIAVEALFEEPIPFASVPHHWRKLWGMDFGIAHPWAGVLIAHDADDDIVHVLRAAQIKDQWPINHSQYILNTAGDVPVAWPHDGHRRDEDKGELHLKYKSFGCKMLLDHAQFKHGGNSVEEGIVEIQERAASGRLKIGSNLLDLHNEWRGYHRESGKIVKIRDDLLDSLRYALMMLRFGKAVPLGGRRVGVSPKSPVARSVQSIDPWTGRAE